jgi:hypothetical protein
MRELERRVLLSVLDRKWREHLYEMDYLQEGIGLRAMAQRDPLVEYQREGYDMFSAMMEAIKEESVGFLFNLEVEIEDSSAAPADGADGLALAPGGTAAEGDGAADGEPHLDAALLAAAQRAQDGPSPGPNGAQPNGRSTAPHISAKGLDRDTSGPTAHLQLADARLRYARGTHDLRGGEFVRPVQWNIEHGPPPAEPQQSEPGQPREPIRARQSAPAQALRARSSSIVRSGSSGCAVRQARALVKQGELGQPS